MRLLLPETTEVISGKIETGIQAVRHENLCIISIIPHYTTGIFVL